MSVWAMASLRAGSNGGIFTKRSRGTDDTPAYVARTFTWVFVTSWTSTTSTATASASWIRSASLSHSAVMASGDDGSGTGCIVSESQSRRRGADYCPGVSHAPLGRDARLPAATRRSAPASSAGSGRASTWRPAATGTSCSWKATPASGRPAWWRNSSPARARRASPSSAAGVTSTSTSRTYPSGRRCSRPWPSELAGRVGRERDVELLGRMGALGDLDLDDLPEGEAGDREHTRQMLALTRLVMEAARARPTAIFVDDIDWVDRATLELLRHLLFRMADEPVTLLVVGTTARRPREPRRGRALPSAWRSSRRHPLPARPHRARGDRVRAATRSGRQRGARRAVSPPPATAIRCSSKRSRSSLGEVNAPDPLSTNGLAFGGSHHPVTDAIATRLLTLGDAGRVAARAAAFLQPNSTREILAAASGLDGAVLDDALAEAIAHGVLVDDPEHPRFTHPLFAHTLIEEMPGPAPPRVPRLDRAAAHRSARRRRARGNRCDRAPPHRGGGPCRSGDRGRDRAPGG